MFRPLTDTSRFKMIFFQDTSWRILPWNSTEQWRSIRTESNALRASDNSPHSVSNTTSFLRTILQLYKERYFLYFRFFLIFDFVPCFFIVTYFLTYLFDIFLYSNFIIFHILSSYCDYFRNEFHFMFSKAEKTWVIQRKGYNMSKSSP